MVAITKWTCKEPPDMIRAREVTMKPKQSFAEWAASGDHTPKGIDPVEWDKKARKYAAGGMVGTNILNNTGDNNIPDMSDGGRIIDGPMYAGGGLLKKAVSALKGTQEVLPAAEREANLAKMLEPSKVQQRLYHGTMATEGGKGQEAIRRMKPSKEGALGSGAYLTPNPKFAGEYAAESGGNILPVYAQIKNPLVLEGKGDPMIEALIKLGMDEATAGKMVERAYETKGYIGKEVESRARAAGYDGLMQYRDGNLSEVVSYNPNAIKSATGNVGTYDVTSPDMSKAEGGDVSKAAFGVFPQMKGKRSKQDPEAAKNVPVDVARGFVAGALGMPGDLESLARIPYDYFRAPTMSELVTGDKTSKTFFPTTEDIEKRLPFRSEAPVSRAASGVGELAGGFYTGPGSAARAITAVPKAVMQAGKDFVMAAPQGAPRMFIGPKAKTWDQAKADRAAQMEKEGQDSVDIWRETGTFRSADGILRQEISDVGAVHRNPTQLKELGKQKKEEAAELQQRLAGIPGQKDMFPKALTEAKKPAREKVKTLKEEADELMRYSDVRGQRAKFALEHPELYKAYPELAEILVYQGNRGFGSERASLRGDPQDMRMEITQSGLRDDPRSSALHEMQHAIQTIEGMGPGGNPAMAYGNPKAFEILEELRKKALEPLSFEAYAKHLSHIPEDQLPKAYEKYVKDIPNAVKAMDRELQSQAAMEYYKRLAGEAEARATQAREPMSASQRAQEFPYSSYDVLPEDLIVNPAKGSSISMQMGPNDYKTVKAGDKLGDLTVGEDISNRGSIEASGIEKVLPGVRAVPMSSFEVTAPHDLFYSKSDLDRVRALAEEIKQSGRIDPMIVGVDEKGNYILEGAHRLGALHLLGAKEFPALMAIEEGAKGFADGGSVDSIRPTEVKNKGALGVANALRKAHEFVSKPFGYDNPPAAMISEFLGVPAVSRTLERIGYGEPLTTGKGMTLKPRDDTTEAALAVLPLAQMTKGLPVGAVIKPKGGNFLTGSVEKAVQPLEVRVRTPGINRHTEADAMSDEALNKWINRNLTNYIKKEMATPEDPVRKLAEQGIDPQGRFQYAPDRNLPTLEITREELGFPPKGMGQSPQAQNWEKIADETAQVETAGDIIAIAQSTDAVAQQKYQNILKENPWLLKVDPSTPVYSPKAGNWSYGDTGFDHIVDVLKQDLAAGRIRPEQLNKVSMEQAVRRTYEFDQEMAKKMREAQIKATEGMPVHKEYPEGYKWIELAMPKLEALPEGSKFQKLPSGMTQVVDSSGAPLTVPAKDEEHALRLLAKERGYKTLEDALKYEGETMGHCVGGYCPDVLEGRSRIFSLRDAKGEPHVTVEVNPSSQRVAPRHEEVLAEMKASGLNTNHLDDLAYDIEYEQALQRVKQNRPPAIVQIKGKQNKAPKEEYLPFVQDFVKGGQWSEVGDFANTGLIKIDPHSDLAKSLTAKGVSVPSYVSSNELTGLLKQAEVGSYVNPSRGETFINPNHPDWADNGMKRGGPVNADCGCHTKAAGGEVKMQAGGIAKTLKKLIGPSAEAAAKEASAAERAAAGRMAADVTKATQPMKMSEALGNLNVEGKGKVKITQSDRTKVGGGNIGGAMFPGLSQVDPLYEGLVWGVGKKPTASGLINQSDDLTYWTTILGAEDQLKTNPIVFNKLRQGFVDAMKQGKLDKELEGKINRNLSLTFGEGADIKDPKIWRMADTFEKRAALADIMLGQGIPPSKGGVALGGEKSGKGVIFKPTDILKRETEPLLLHPEHGGDVPTFSVGPRLFQFSGGMKVRPDLHPGFPVLLEGQDLGMVFKPAPGEVAMRDFTQRMASERGRKPGYYEWTMGEKGKGLPSQDITEEYLTYLQNAGYAKGGKVGGLPQSKKQRKK